MSGLLWRRRLSAVARGSVLVLVSVLYTAAGIGDLEQGNRLYREGRYAEAVEAYRSALEDGNESPVLHYNLGTALLQIGRIEEAVQHLQAALAAVDPDLRPRAAYNLGTGYLHAGRAAQNPDQRNQLLDAAVETFKTSLRLNPADLDAKWNLELALREREESPQQGGGGQGDQDQNRQEQQNQQDQGDDRQPSGNPPQQPPSQQRPDPTSRGEQAPLTPEEAERILNAVQQDEREVYRDRLRQERSDVRVLRDW